MEVKIRIAGAAGQGMQTAQDMLGKAITRSGLYGSSYSDAESRIRGGLNFSHMRISDRPRFGVTDETDILVALSKPAVELYGSNICKKGLVLTAGDWDHSCKAGFDLYPIAEKAGSIKAVSTVAFASVSTILGIPAALVYTIIDDFFGKNEKLMGINITAAELAMEAASGIDGMDGFRFTPGETSAGRLWLSGGDAIALGAVAGGVSFISAYPMSPSTSIMTNLAQWADETGVVVEQAEDEIAAINMLAGASYAGARAMTATSGGGFCLMAEGLSNIGMIEVPAVIVLAQRPGPATGLPTRTAQGDLGLARHAGHGHFARIIKAPRNIQECFEITARAFDITEKYQAPVIILTDQQMQDSYASVEMFDTSNLPVKRHLPTEKKLSRMKTYQRYAQTDSGISPMAPPGISKHVVYVDSDEHDEDGHMVESAELAQAMASKRMRKMATIAEELADTPKLDDARDAPLVVSWGSSYETIAEVRELLADEGNRFSMLHMETLWPIDSTGLSEIVGKASKIIAVENSVGCDIDCLLRETVLRAADEKITKLDGRPFNIEELKERIGEVIG